MAQQNFGDFQNEIYLAGLTGQMPSLPVDFASLEALAKEAMSPSVWSYVAGGCGDEFTQRNNVEAFDRYGLVPRMCAGSTKRDLSISLVSVRRGPRNFLARAIR